MESAVITRGVTFTEMTDANKRNVGFRLDGIDTAGHPMLLILEEQAVGALVDVLRGSFPDFFAVEPERSLQESWDSTYVGKNPQPDSVLSKVISLLPDATIGEDSEGQLVVNTGIYPKS